MLGVLAVSSATGEGLDELRARILAELPELQPSPSARAREPAANSRPSTASTGRSARAATGSSARRTAPSASSAAASSCSSSATTSKTKRRSPISSSACSEIGVIAALAKAGFEAGDEVRVGEHEFELHI